VEEVRVVVLILFLILLAVLFPSGFRIAVQLVLLGIFALFMFAPTVPADHDSAKAPAGQTSSAP
jgi:hypothetical protein